MSKKICTSCDVRKSVTDFDFNGNGKRRRGVCKKCRNRRRWPGSSPRKPRLKKGVKVHCSKCEKFLNESDFTRRGIKKSGLQSWCRACMNDARKTPKAIASRKIWYGNNVSKITENRRAWRKREPLRSSWLGLKNRVQSRRDIDITITYDDFVMLMSVTNCPICNVEMLEKGTHGRHDQDMKTVDRIKPGGDYSPVNCACICKRCNQIKNDGTFEEHLAIAQWMINQEDDVNEKQDRESHGRDEGDSERGPSSGKGHRESDTGGAPVPDGKTS